MSPTRYGQFQARIPQLSDSERANQAITQGRRLVGTCNLEGPDLAQAEHRLRFLQTMQEQNGDPQVILRLCGALTEFVARAEEALVCHIRQTWSPKRNDDEQAEPTHQRPRGKANKRFRRHQQAA